MVKYVGCVDLPGICLKYYVFGNQREGFGVRITSSNGESSDQYVSQNLFSVLDLARKLKRCSVFPENLIEIIEDIQYSEAFIEESRKLSI